LVWRPPYYWWCDYGAIQ